MRLAGLTALGAVFAASVVWAEGPSFDCAKADSDTEDAICNSPELSALDVEMTRLFNLAIKGKNLTDARRDELRSYQLGWIKGRNECWKSDLGVDACVQQEYALRIAELRTSYADANTESPQSIGPLPYVCDGLDVPVISAVFINVGDPSLAVLTWRDGFMVMPQVISGSGARYSNGKSSFWIKGKEAQLTTFDGSVHACKEDVTG